MAPDYVAALHEVLASDAGAASDEESDADPASDEVLASATVLVSELALELVSGSASTAQIETSRR